MAFHLSSGQVGALGSSSVADLLGRCRRVHVSMDPLPFLQGNSMLLSVIAHPPAHLFWVRFFYDARRATFRCLGGLPLLSPRSEERRVGKECRSRWAWDRYQTGT